MNDEYEEKEYDFYYDFPEVLDACDECEAVDTKLYKDKLSGMNLCQNCRPGASFSKNKINKKRKRDNDYDES